ncbi:MAG: tetrahydromethanopterin S-methyltransferase subunit A [Phycisphaerales bacterium]|nr:MAG: tetrahydromethanopterin S-methyltransferase subunit A [Phycisphaerales bacterium]
MAKAGKTEPAVGYPPEEGCYLRGNDYSPVAVVVILRWGREETPADIEKLVRVATESGAALAGTLQTENIGIEKIICNVVANPNIRYLIVCGPESPGHLAGEALLALAENGLDERKRIIGTEAPTPYIFNLQPEFVQRFRDQVALVNLVNEGSPEVLRQGVWTCYQEEPAVFRGYRLHDPGAYPAEPLSGKITWRVTQPSSEPKSNEERAQRDKIMNLIEHIRKSNQRGGHLNIEQSQGEEDAYIQEQDR